MIKKGLALLLTAIMALSLAACGSSASSADSAPAADSGTQEEAAEEEATEEEPAEEEAAAEDTASGDVTVGLLTYSLGEEFGVDTLSGMQKVADAQGWKLEAPDPAGDLQKQISQLEDMIQKKTDVVCIAAIDASAIVPYLEEAHEAGVKIVNYDILAETDVCDAYIAADNTGGGESAAKELAEAIGGKGKILVLTDNPGVAVIEERCQSFMNYIKENYPDIELVDQISNGTRDVHQRTTENMLTAHPDLAGIFAPDGDHTLGAYSACKQMERTEVKVMGYDASPEQITIMQQDGPDGILLGSVAQFPIMLGRICGETTIKVLNGEEISDTILVDTGLAMANDIDNFAFLE